MKKKLVIIIDGEPEGTMLRHLMAEHDLDATAFGSGEEALRYFGLGEVPDLIVTDLHLPDMDGRRLCRLLRSWRYRPYHRVPIVVAVPRVTDELIATMVNEAGADALLPQPLDDKAFMRKVHGLLRNGRAHSAPRVLIVDDSRTLALLLKQAFDDRGYHADTAYDGRQALDRLNERSYDWVVLDYHLPDMRGDTIAALIGEKWPRTIVIVMTADSRPDLACHCLQKGAAAFLQKPFDLAVLLELCSTTREPSNHQ